MEDGTPSRMRGGQPPMYQSTGYGAGIVGARSRSGSLGVRRTSPLADEDDDIEYGSGGNHSYEHRDMIAGVAAGATGREAANWMDSPQRNSIYGYAISPVDGSATVGRPGRVRARSSSYETNVMRDNGYDAEDVQAKRRSDASGVEPASWLRSSVVGHSSNRNSGLELDPFVEGELAAQAAYMAQFSPDSELGLGGERMSPPRRSLSYNDAQNASRGGPDESTVVRPGFAGSVLLNRASRSGPIPIIGEGVASGSGSGSSSASGLASRSVSGLGLSTAPTTVENRRISFSLLPTTTQTPPSAWTAADKGKGRETNVDPGSNSSVGHGDSSERLVRPGQRSQSSLETSSQGHGLRGLGGILQAASSQGHSSASDEGKSHLSGGTQSGSSGSGSASNLGSNSRSSSRQKGKSSKPSSPSPDSGFFGLTRPSLSSLRAKFKIGSSSRSRSPSPPDQELEKGGFAGVLTSSPGRASFDVAPRRTSTSVSLPTRPFSTFSAASIYSQAGVPLSNRDRVSSADSRTRGSWTSPPSPVLSFAQRKSPRRASQPGPMPNFPRPPPVSNLMFRSAVSNSAAFTSSSGPSQSQSAFVPTLTAIAATPSPSVGGGTNNNVEGLLDPLLMLRLREQPSVSTIGLHDHEDYSRPFRAWVQNRQDSSTSVGSVNTGASGAADVGHGPNRNSSPDISSLLSITTASRPRTPDIGQD
ncbi:hypothetical protein SCHPADRAFT_943632 [Schizopora paradoxa]|uniref:Uncharacterized protein n=1 Tax=Schizopora paradoxa TaxID=27342 RepID=A0A0H2RXH8_9AGAM|nr:hypothetical protein SCHPADRAFT_943632 [Schizopora paradoxa]